MHDKNDKNNVYSKSVGKNAILNILKTLLSIIFPLITFPYVTRVLGVDNLGKVNFANSIVSYFALLAALGISTYSVREGSRLRDHKDKLENLVKEIFSINIVSTLIVYILIVFAIFFVRKLQLYSALILIQSLSIVFTTIGVEWINVIYEDYAYITLRSFIVQLISLACLFLFVKQQGDYYIYAGIIALGQGIISFLNIFHIRKYCRIKVGIPREFKTHIKPILVLFSNNIAVAIYVNSDITMLGWMTSDYYVGLYAVSVKIYTIIKQLIAAIYSVVMARMSYYVSSSDSYNYKILLNQIICMVITVAIPATIGLSCVSEEVIELISGKEYIQAAASLRILSIAFLFAIMGGIIANCINLPFKRESINLKATSISAIVNIILNVFLIPIYRQNGAALTTLISEITVCGILVFRLKEFVTYLNMKHILKTILKSSLAGGSIAICAFLFKSVVGISGLHYLVIEIITGIISYIVISVLLRNDTMLEILNRIRKKVVG